MVFVPFSFANLIWFGNSRSIFTMTTYARMKWIKKSWFWLKLLKTEHMSSNCQFVCSSDSWQLTAREHWFSFILWFSVCFFSSFFFSIYTQYSFILTLFLFLFYYTKLKYRSIYFPHCSLFKECTQNLSCWYNHLVLSYCPLKHIVISAVKCEIVCEWLVLQLNIGQYVFSLARSFTVKAYSWAIVFYFSFIFLLLLLCIVRMVFCGNNNK